MDTVDEYLSSLPADRRDAISTIRDTINANLPPGYQEGIQYGMISWFVPESVLPAKSVYNGQPLSLVGLGSQKNHMALYMMCVYGDPGLRAWFEIAYKSSGKKLDMGKSCVRFKTLDALALDVIGEAVSKVPVERYIESYQTLRGAQDGASQRTLASGAATAPAKPVANPTKKSAKPIKAAAKSVKRPPAKGAKATAKKPAKAKAKATATAKKPAKKPAKSAKKK